MVGRRSRPVTGRWALFAAPRLVDQVGDLMAIGDTLVHDTNGGGGSPPKGRALVTATMAERE